MLPTLFILALTVALIALAVREARQLRASNEYLPEVAPVGFFLHGGGRVVIGRRGLVLGDLTEADGFRSAAEARAYAARLNAPTRVFAV